MNALRLLPLLLLMSCAVMTPFDQNSYNAAQDLKIEAASLLAKATAPADAYKADITELRVKLDAQVAYEQGKGKANLISAQQWKILASPDNDLLGRFLKNWQDGQKFDAIYIEEKAKQISNGFDEILRLEGNKKL